MPIDGSKVLQGDVPHLLKRIACGYRICEIDGLPKIAPAELPGVCRCPNCYGSDSEPVYCRCGNKIEEARKEWARKNTTAPARTCYACTPNPKKPCPREDCGLIHPDHWHTLPYRDDSPTER